MTTQRMIRTLKKICAPASLLCSLLSLARPSFAQPPVGTTTTCPPCKQEGSDRELKEHAFQFPTFLDSSFIATYLGQSTRVGELTAGHLPTAFGDLSVKATTIREQVDFAVKLAPILNVTALFGARALTGTNGPSLVYAGLTYDYGGAIGANLRVFRSDESGTQVTLRIQGGYTRGQIASIVSVFASDTALVALSNIVQGNLGQMLVTPYRLFLYGGSVTAAQTISRVFGLQGAFAIGGSSATAEAFDATRGARVDSTQDNFNYQFAAAIDADFAPVGAPVAAMFEYVGSHIPTLGAVSPTALNTTHTMALGAYYSGRHNLQAGLQGALQLGLEPVASQQGISDRPKNLLAVITLRYIW